MKRKILIASILFMGFALSACSNATPTLKGSFNLIISSENTEVINVDDLAKMEGIATDVIEKTQVGENTVSVQGVDLQVLLNEYDLNQSDLEKITLIATDGYEKEIPSEVLQSKQVLLVYMVDDKPLSDEVLPLWVVIPNEKAQFWVKSIASIKIN